MDTKNLADVVATYLKDRDDVAQADIVEESEQDTAMGAEPVSADAGYATVMVETQGGEMFAVEVRRA